MEPVGFDTAAPVEYREAEYRPPRTTAGRGNLPLTQSTGTPNLGGHHVHPHHLSIHLRRAWIAGLVEGFASTGAHRQTGCDDLAVSNRRFIGRATRVGWRNRATFEFISLVSL